MDTQDLEIEENINFIEKMNAKKKKEIIERIRNRKISKILLQAIINDFTRHMQTITGTLENYNYNFSKEVIKELAIHYGHTLEGIYMSSDQKYFYFMESILKPYVEQGKAFPLPWLQYIQKYMNGEGFESIDDKVKIIKVGFEMEKDGKPITSLPKVSDN